MRKLFLRRERRKGNFRVRRNRGRVVIFSKRDVDALRMICWCQYVFPRHLRGIITDIELENLIHIGFVKHHVKSGSLVLTGKGSELVTEIFSQQVPALTKSYHNAAIQRRLRQSGMAATAYYGAVNIFSASHEELSQSPSLFLSTITRRYEMNPWGNVRIAAIANLGGTLYAVHYVCPGIGKLALTDELTAFTNQTARFRDTRRAFIFAGESYTDILTELEQTDKTNTKLILYGDAYRSLQLPVHLLSCNDTGAVQLQIMAVPDYRKKLTQAALKNQYQPPPKDVPVWDALFQGLPFVMAADMDLRRIDAAIRAAHGQGIKQIAVAALRGQAETVLFPCYRDPGLARVFVLTDEAISEVTGRPPLPYTPPRTQFITPKGDVIDAPPFQTHGKTGRSH